jgi:Ca-activated chloride channel family protein
MLARRLVPMLLALSLGVAGAGAARAPGIVFTGQVVDAAGAPIAGATVTVAAQSGATTDVAGRYQLAAPASIARGQEVTVLARRVGFEQERRRVRVGGDTVRVDFVLRASALRLSGVVVTGTAAAAEPRQAKVGATVSEAAAAVDLTAAVTSNAVALASPAPATVDARRARGVPAGGRGVARDSTALGVDPQRFNTEAYDRIYENPFIAVRTAPLSTFSIDVDHASYSNVRRFLTSGQRPPADAVRIEELVNYFTYSYPSPEGDQPFSVSTEVASAPWSSGHQLVRVGLQGRRIPTAALPASNLVFLIDVSGSMQPPNKLPLVKQAFRLLVNQLRAEDRVAIVVYAGAAGLVLPSTSGSEKERILAAIDRLEAGGSTAGGEGLRLAYDVARAHHRRGANNRVVLATDGDFNVGESSDAAMVRLIEQRREEGTYLTVLGVGTGNLKDSKMEQLANKGNGNYAYLDNLLEAQKALVHEMGGTLVTIAKDVKLQVEFNPARVAAYRLIGYENRLLRDEDFNDDAKDAGELGAGHAVTALYEVIPVGAADAGRARGVDPLRYERPDAPAGPAANEGARRAAGGDELLFIKLRYKHPDGGPSRLLTHAVPAASARPVRRLHLRERGGDVRPRAPRLGAQGKRHARRGRRPRPTLVRQRPGRLPGRVRASRRARGVARGGGGHRTAGRAVSGSRASAGAQRNGGAGARRILGASHLGARPCPAPVRASRPPGSPSSPPSWRPRSSPRRRRGRVASRPLTLSSTPRSGTFPSAPPRGRATPTPTRRGASGSSGRAATTSPTATAGPAPSSATRSTPAPTRTTSWWRREWCGSPATGTAGSSGSIRPPAS